MWEKFLYTDKPKSIGVGTQKVQLWVDAVGQVHPIKLSLKNKLSKTIDDDHCCIDTLTRDGIHYVAYSQLLKMTPKMLLRSKLGSDHV